MIRFEHLEANVDVLHRTFVDAQPFSYLVIDNFCDEPALAALLNAMPSPDDGSINKSRDYVFAKNKFEKSNFREIGPAFEEIYSDLMSDRFQTILRAITGDPVFVDPKFHGGGIHQGGEGSFLDMHVDFTCHPMHQDWFRNLNILLYLNKNWLPEHGGQLKLRHKETGLSAEIEPIFNRCVIMHTRGYTLHGYDRLNFPEGAFRRSIATYAYHLTDEPVEGRSTVWYPEQGNALKRLLGKSWPKLVAAKTRLFGSATAKNG